MLETVIVVPCFNEAERLPRNPVLRFAQEHPEIHLLLVNDGSSDGTLALLQDIAAASTGNISVEDQQPNQGKAEAVRTGVLAAYAMSPRFIGYWDADLATPLEEIPRFIAVLEERPKVEIVFGSRVKLLGRSIERRAVRHIMGRVFATVASLTLGLPVYDTQCGAKLFRATPAMGRLFAEPWITGWIFDVEWIARLIETRRINDQPPAQEVIYELPLRTWHDVAGSKLKPRDFLRAIFEMAAIRRRYFR